MDQQKNYGRKMKGRGGEIGGASRFDAHQFCLLFEAALDYFTDTDYFTNTTGVSKIALAKFSGLLLSQNPPV